MNAIENAADWSELTSTQLQRTEGGDCPCPDACNNDAGWDLLIGGLLILGSYAIKYGAVLAALP